MPWGGCGLAGGMLSNIMEQHTQSDRRGFLKTAAGVSGGLFLGAGTQAVARPLAEKEKLDRIGSNTWPIRYIFKPRTNRPNPRSEQMKKKSCAHMLLDFPPSPMRPCRAPY